MPATGIFELAAITGGTGRVQSDDVLALVDVHDATQAAQGSLVKITLAQLYRTETTPVTVSTPLPDIAQAWNAGGVTFTAIRLNVTDTASAAASLLLDLQVGGVSKMSVRKDGLLTAATVAIAQLLVNTPGAGAEAVRVNGTILTNSALVSPLLQLTAAASKIVPGATSLSLRNTADTADNLLITDVGIVTVRNHLLFATDGTNDIGASGGPNRPRNIYATGTIGASGNFAGGYLLLLAAAAQPTGTGLSLGNTTAATATLGGGALPAGPVAFLVGILNGTSIRIPYYNV